MKNYFDETGRVTHEIGRFGGLKRPEDYLGGDSSFELRNLRILADGSLKRREGFAPALTLPGTIRGIYSALRNGVREYYAVADDLVYSLSPSATGFTATQIGEIGTNTGEVSFFCYDQQILLLDGVATYTLAANRCGEVQPYIPLYAAAWTESVSNRVVNEEPNILTKKLWFHFKLTSSTSTLTMGNTIAAVHWVYFNGQRATKPTFAGSTLGLGETRKSGDVIDVCLSFTDAFYTPWYTSAPPALRRGTTIGDAENEVILFYGNDDPSEVYISTRPPAENMAALHSYEADSCGIYLKKDCRVSFGDKIHPITGACRHFDRSLVFTDNGCWMTEGQSDEGFPPFALVNTSFGCGNPGGPGVYKNAPVTIWSKRLLIWNSQTDERDECNADIVSRDVQSLLYDGLGDGARIFIDERHGEIWLYTPGENRRIFVYSPEMKHWTTFDGFTPDGIVMFGETVAFYAGSTLFCFDDSMSSDVDAAGAEHGIDVEFVSQFFDFGKPGQIKRGCRGVICLDCDAQEVTVTMESGDGRRHEAVLSTGEDGLTDMTFGGIPHRFRHARLGVTGSDAGALRILAMRTSATV